MSAPINLLVVDDIAQNLTAIEALLARPGLVILRAASGAEALELLLANEVALALIDVQMPHMDGFELAELIRGSERTRAIPLIFLTAATREPSYSFRGYEAGAVDFMFKPLDPQALIGKVKVFVELYQQKRQLAAQLAELKHALHLNEMFIAVLGHDLRTPLSVVMNGAMLLPMLTDLPKVVATATRIGSSARRMTQMVDQLLDLARVRSGSMQLRTGSHDYAGICAALADEFHATGQPTRIVMRTVGDVCGVVDAGIFSQVLSNLIGNALTHGTPGEAVGLSLDGSARDSIVVRVSSAGVIPAQLLPKIFQPFHQGSASRRAGKGLGLGLYMVHMFVHAHSGQVGVTSCERQGTTFTVSMPRHPADTPAPA